MHLLYLYVRSCLPKLVGYLSYLQEVKYPEAWGAPWCSSLVLGQRQQEGVLLCSLLGRRKPEEALRLLRQALGRA